MRCGLLLCLVLLAPAGPPAAVAREYAAVFNFGDSLTDTGNAAIYPPTAGGTFTELPYGQTYFGRPSGRASDGRIITDFLGNQPQSDLSVDQTNKLL